MFSITKSEEKICQIHICNFHYVAKHIEQRLKTCILSWFFVGLKKSSRDDQFFYIFQ
jgi:hypothetical protein